MTLTPPRRPQTATLFVQVLALVVLSLFIAQAINVWVVLQLPRPKPEFYTAPEITQALLRGAEAPQSDDARPLVVTLEAKAPPIVQDARFFHRLRNQVAASLNVPPERIRVSDSDYADRRLIRDVRARLAKVGQSDVPFVIAPFQVSVQQPDGRWLTARPPRSRLPNVWQQRVILWYLITAAAMIPMVWLVSRRLSGSVAVFAEAAERLGRDPNAPPLQAKGPSEIRPAIDAFNEMQDRLRRYVVDRTAMAAAMAHDLRTPLTRLRFRIESAPPDVRDKMAADIDEMEAMISASLAYVRDQRRTAHTPMELSSLIESIVDDMAETGAPVTVDRADRVVLRADPMGLKRMATNLIENACKFGGSARCRVINEGGVALIQVEDDGAGIPEADLEKVFEPFYRGEPSRSRETGGSGLGLAAVRSIARAHGGDATVRNKPAGGLIAEVRLPL